MSGVSSQPSGKAQRPCFGPAFSQCRPRETGMMNQQVSSDTARLLVSNGVATERQTRLKSTELAADLAQSNAPSTQPHLHRENSSRDSIQYSFTNCDSSNQIPDTRRSTLPPSTQPPSRIPTHSLSSATTTRVPEGIVHAFRFRHGQSGDQVSGHEFSDTSEKRRTLACEDTHSIKRRKMYRKPIGDVTRVDNLPGPSAHEVAGGKSSGTGRKASIVLFACLQVFSHRQKY